MNDRVIMDEAWFRTVADNLKKIENERAARLVGQPALLIHHPNFMASGYWHESDRRATLAMFDWDLSRYPTAYLEHFKGQSRIEIQGVAETAYRIMTGNMREMRIANTKRFVARVLMTKMTRALYEPIPDHETV